MNKMSRSLERVRSKDSLDAVLSMAKRLGLNIDKTGDFNSREQEFWGNPWSDLVRSLYEKRFGIKGS